MSIHRVTAIAGDPVNNLSLYTRDLGLRFIKKTVNFDDPSTYHFYCGDETGSPGLPAARKDRVAEFWRCQAGTRAREWNAPLHQLSRAVARGHEGE
jgi:catechol 2,3-dioxygenase-like lactoylglutathione lyase family enzyme